MTAAIVGEAIVGQTIVGDTTIDLVGTPAASYPVAWPVVRAHLAEELPAVLSAYTVYNGPVVTGDAPSHFLTIAHQPSASVASAGTFRQDVGPDGFRATEGGEILCELGAVTGDTTVPDVFSAFNDLASFVQADMTLSGLLTQGSTVLASADVVQDQTTSGAVQRLLVTISYFTRIP